MRDPYSFLRFDVVLTDEHLIELNVAASSGEFFGQVQLYVAHTTLRELAESLRGFPNREHDRRDFILGQDDLPGYGSVRIAVYSVDWQGHVEVEVSLQKCAQRALTKAECAVVILHLAIGDIDRFSDELMSLDPQVGACAFLKGT